MSAFIYDKQNHRRQVGISVVSQKCFARTWTWTELPFCRDCLGLSFVFWSIPRWCLLFRFGFNVQYVVIISDNGLPRARWLIIIRSNVECVPMFGDKAFYGLGNRCPSYLFSQNTLLNNAQYIPLNICTVRWCPVWFMCVVLPGGLISSHLRY